MKLSTTFTTKLVSTNTKMVGNSQTSPSSYRASDFTKFVTKPKFRAATTSIVSYPAKNPLFLYKISAQAANNAGF